MGDSSKRGKGKFCGPKPTSRILRRLDPCGWEFRVVAANLRRARGFLLWVVHAPEYRHLYIFMYERVMFYFAKDLIKAASL